MSKDNSTDDEIQDDSENLNYQSLSDEKLMIILTSPQKDNQAKAFSVLYSKYHNKMVKFLYGFVYDTHVAEDLFQDAMIKLYKNLEKFNINEKFSSWFYRIVTNIALTYLKKNKKRDSIINEVNLDKNNLEIIDIREDNPENQFLDNEFWLKFSSVVSGLPEKFRVIFLMRFQNQESFKEISKIFHLSERTVKWRMKKAISLLREKLKEEGYG